MENTYGELAYTSRLLNSWCVKHDALKERMADLEEHIEAYKQEVAKRSE